MSLDRDLCQKRPNEPVVKIFALGPLETNCYVVHDPCSQKGIVIDPGVYDNALVRYLDKENIDVVTILNTHGHADHIMGDAGFDKEVSIHELDVPWLSDTSKNMAYIIEATVEPVKKVKRLKDGDIITFGSLQLEVIHTPGHTPGGICARCNDLLFSGDTLFYEGVGRTDLPGGSHDDLMQSVRKKLFALPDSVKVFPGHGPDTTIGHEKRHNPFV